MARWQPSPLVSWGMFTNQRFPFKSANKQAWSSGVLIIDWTIQHGPIRCRSHSFEVCPRSNFLLWGGQSRILITTANLGLPSSSYFTLVHPDVFADPAKIKHYVNNMQTFQLTNFCHTPLPLSEAKLMLQVQRKRKKIVSVCTIISLSTYTISLQFIKTK